MSDYDPLSISNIWGYDEFPPIMLQEAVVHAEEEEDPDASFPGETESPQRSNIVQVFLMMAVKQK